MKIKRFFEIYYKKINYKDEIEVKILIGWFWIILIILIIIF